MAEDPRGRAQAALQALPDEQLTWAADLLERLGRAAAGGPWGRAGELLGLELDEMRPGAATVRLEDDGLFHHAGQRLMGGVVAGLVDHAMGAAVAPLLGEDEMTATTHLTCRYLRPVRGGTLTATARVEYDGRRAYEVRAEVHVDGELVALAEGSFARVGAAPDEDAAWRTVASDARKPGDPASG